MIVHQLRVELSEYQRRRGRLLPLLCCNTRWARVSRVCSTLQERCDIRITRLLPTARRPPPNLLQLHLWHAIECSGSQNNRRWLALLIAPTNGSQSACSKAFQRTKCSVILYAFVYITWVGLWVQLNADYVHLTPSAFGQFLCSGIHICSCFGVFRL